MVQPRDVKLRVLRGCLLEKFDRLGKILLVHVGNAEIIEARGFGRRRARRGLGLGAREIAGAV